MRNGRQLAFHQSAIRNPHSATEESAIEMNCPNCHQPMREGAQFCTRCGTRTASGRAAFEESVPTVERADAVQAATVVAGDPLIGRVLDGKYEIISPLGAGGMGAVYRARRVLIGDDVAVKILHAKFTGDDNLVERFRREARAAAQLHHPNVVTIHDYGEARGHEGFAYIVMELVSGEPMRDLLRREGKLETNRAVALMSGVCAGVGAAHRRGIVHRDIKPDNIIVAPADEDSATERVKVVDFGIAKLRDMAHDATLTEAGAMVGTPFYMSPEQCKGEPLDARADVYSLGALLYEMLAGEPPFVAPSLTGIILKHINEPPPPMPQALRVPPALQAAIIRSLSKDPNARQRDATEFARDLQAAAAQDSATAVIPPAQKTAANFDAATRPAQVTPTPPAQPQSQQTHGDARQQNYVAAQPQNQVGGQQQAFYAAQQQQAYVAPPPRSSRAPLVIALVVIVIVAVGGFAALGIILLSRGAGDNTNVRANANTRPTPAATQTPTPTATATQTPAHVNLNVNRTSNANTSSAPVGSLEHSEQKLLAGALLTPEDLNGLSPAQLRILRNTIYARYGRTFDAPELQAYFMTRPWYHPRPEYNERMLTSNDRANAELIKSYEGGR
jgi:serine/threonine protein kinase